MGAFEGISYYNIQAAGIRCRLCSFGASIVSVEVPDARGDFLNVALSPTSFEGGAVDPALAGRTIGPCCGRVKDGAISIDGREYLLEKNEGRNHLHGGSSGCAYQNWRGEQLSPSHARFQLVLPDGLAGYPGNRTIQADYTASDGRLQVVYTVETDRPTYLNMTNHAYWDLSGRFDGSAMRQTLEIAADRYVRNSTDQSLLDIVPAIGGAFDFTAPAVPADRLREYPEDEQLILGNGFDNYLILSDELRGAWGFAARMSSPDSGIRMTIHTDQPAVVLYTGGGLDGRTRINGESAGPGRALALEAQGMPDPFHLNGSRADIVRPGSQWRRTIRWSFDLIL